MSFVSDAVSSVTGKGAQKAAEGAAKSSKKITDEQLRQLKLLYPFLEKLGPAAMDLIAPVLQDAQTSAAQARQFDPAQETALAMQAYDTAAKQSLSTDIGTVNTGYTGRGFTGGNASSDQNAANEDVLARRAAERGQYASSLKLRETDRRDEVTGRAADRTARAFQLLDPTGRTSQSVGALQGPANTNLNLANMYQGQADAAAGNASALVGLAGSALKGVKFPWQKKKALSFDSMI